MSLLAVVTDLAFAEPSSPGCCQDSAPASRPAEPAALPPTLQTLLTNWTGSWLDDNRIRFYGYVEGSYTYNYTLSKGEDNILRYFDTESNTPLLNQAVLTIERAVKIADEFDWGFRFDSMFGYDVDLIHSNGMFDIDTSSTHQRYGYDAPQVYADVVLPVANGVHVLAGKWYTPICYETVNPTTTPFYSHSFLFMFGTPYTHSGLRADVPLDSEWSLTGAVIRGWEQSTDDNNDSESFYAGASYANAASGTGGSIVVISGPEQPDNDGDYRTLVDVILTQTVTEKFSVAVNGDYATEKGSSSGGGNAKWYGVAAYGAYDHSSNVRSKLRVEWFHDGSGTRTGVDTDLYEATAGLTWTPFPDGGWLSSLTIRPEARCDYATEPIYNGYHTQFTVAVDLIFKF